MGLTIRLHGRPPEVESATARLAAVFTVDGVSRPYPDRAPSELVRVYIDVRTGEQP